MADFFWFSDEQWARIEPLLPTKHRPCSEIAPGFAYYFDHMGFDYRAFKSELEKHFQIERMKGGPFPAFGAIFNPEINFLVRSKAL